MARKRLATTKQTHRLTNNTTVNIPDCTAVEPVRDSCCLPALPLRSNPRNKPRNYVGRDTVRLYRLRTGGKYSIYYLRLETEPMEPPASFERLGVAFYAFAKPQPGTVPVYLYTGVLKNGPQVYYYSSVKGAPPPGYPKASQVAFHAYPPPKLGGRIARGAVIEA